MLVVGEGRLRTVCVCVCNWPQNLRKNCPLVHFAVEAEPWDRPGWIKSAQQNPRSVSWAV